MKRLFALLALVAITVPLLAGQMVPRVEAQDAAPSRPGQTWSQSIPLPGTVLGFDPDAEAPFDTLERARQPALQNQVRIERRVVIRIGPAAQEARRQMMSELPRRPMRTRYEEVDHGNCIDAEDVIGVQPTNDNRLLFFTGGDQILAASLENGCSARAFYAGFYIERSEDRRLCVARDRLQSRAGASCQVDDFTRLVAVAD
ncbi:hypothetical protein [Aurantiacibacter marinus]|uniref:Uncharacterized protein n=1 Tax=Aurantiacibacter marinus TaxID=874156 RepID=A0A0H0XNM6_9SPHN|nr:hypothetical protein [Aurantiacibacter marinus]KLI63626.1 hypothetical protein AAV99_07745 [Aurantiacibacter marinus]